jgi:signal transduction histidine kinase/ActR/RegA family two-component response regulator
VASAIVDVTQATIMDEKLVPKGILPDSEAAGLTEELPGEERASGTVLSVVCIGASAGGLEVFRRLLADLPADTGFAIVFVQHLDPNHHSMLPEILARATAMPVGEAADGMPVEANHVSLYGLLRGGRSFPDFEVEQDFPGVGRRSLVLGGCHINHHEMILLAVDDITDHKLAQQALRRSEEHLRQSQKMDAVGRLAGGIAHDFNNLLTAIIGYSDLLHDSLAGNEWAIEQVLEIKTAGERAASLTQQLLAFSRRQILQPKVLDLNAIVADFTKMLSRLVGERIEVSVNCAPGLWQVRADPAEIGRAIMNLWLNARDAMPQGGTLTVETANLTLAGTDVSVEDLSPGRYVTMAVHDTGVGIDAEMQAHIFEPFFTTKEAGKGTGLGLATVLGIVEQSGGVIRCESEPGRGTSFKIFLPAVGEALDKGASPAGSLGKAPRGSEVVLLVEDEDAVRKLARIILEASGYVVLDARNGREGLALCETHHGPIDLLVTDVMMPELGGRELAEGAIKLRPGLKVMFMSGHTEDTVLKEGVQKGTAFLQKPFTPARLAQKVRETLDSADKSAGQP